MIAESGDEYDLVMLGDSITHNFDMTRADPTKPGAGHNAFLELERKYKVLNCGYSGDGYQHLLWRIRNGELEGVKARIHPTANGYDDFWLPAILGNM